MDHEKLVHVFISFGDIQKVDDDNSEGLRNVTLKNLRAKVLTIDLNNISSSRLADGIRDLLNNSVGHVIYEVHVEEEYDIQALRG